MPRAVVDHRDRVVGVDRDLDRVVAAGQRLVDRVVDHLVDEVVQAAHTGRADVHAGPLAHRLETLEDGDVLRVVPGALLVGLAVVWKPRCLSSHTSDAPAGGHGPPGPGRGHNVVMILAGGPPRPAGSAVTKVLQNRRKTHASGIPYGRLPRLYPQPAHGGPPERLVEALDDQLGHQVELLRADRLGARDEHLAVALRPRLAVRRERRRRPPPATRAGPRRAASRAPDGRSARSSAPETGVSASREPPHPPARSAPPRPRRLQHTALGDRHALDAGVLGARHVAELGGRDHALAGGRAARRPAAPRRVASSSLITSSSSSSGGAPRSAASSSRSASSSASRPSRTCPREP